eukprot:9066172-Karenia_brevis.AAC.1
MSVPWCPVATMFDASSWGAGVMEKDIGPEWAHKIGRHNERWRFSKTSEAGVCFRDEVLNFADKDQQPRTIPAVPEHIWRGSWKRVISSRWKLKAAQVVLEGYSYLRTCRHVARNTQNFGKHHLVIGDAMSVVLGTTKGRSSRPDMAQVFQKSGALALACNIQFHARWVPSECNSADPASRGRKSCRAELDTPQHVGKA